MLVLTRKKDESIKIGDEITVQVVAVQGNRVKIGISAPDGVRILRSELELKPAPVADFGMWCEVPATQT